MREGFSIGVFIFTLAVSPVLSGCASRLVQNDSSHVEYLHDELFSEHGRYAIESHEEIFHLDRTTKEYLDKHLRRVVSGSVSSVNEDGFSDLITKIVKDFSYENLSDTPASQTFQDKTANCLSLSIMTYSVARYLGFEVTFQMVNIPEYWEWHDSTGLVARHVNLLLKRKSVPGVFDALNNEIEIDFFSPGSSRRYGARKIEIPTVIAMYYNNKGAQALLAGSHDTAYAYFRAALVKDPSLNMALSNLALLYAMNNKLEWSKQAYRQALRGDPDDMVAASGLAAVYKLTGEMEKAERLLDGIRERRNNNPYYLYVRGEEAYSSGEWGKSIEFFKKSISLRPDIDLFYFGLAKSYFQMGEYELAERYMRQAERAAQIDAAKKRYRSKLVLLTDY